MGCLQQLPYPVPDDIKRRVIYDGVSRPTGQRYWGTFTHYVYILLEMLSLAMLYKCPKFLGGEGKCPPLQLACFSQGSSSIVNIRHADVLQQTRTRDAQRGNSLHCTDKNSLPLPNFQLWSKHIFSATSSPIFQISLIYAFIGVCSLWRQPNNGYPFQLFSRIGHVQREPMKCFSG